MVSIKEFYKRNKKVIDILLEVLYIVIFIGLATFVGSKHEHWADEAQSWLIARDLRFIDIIKYIKYEGTPPLWHFVLRMFILCGGEYNQLIFLTTLFSIIGIIFLFKNKKVPLLVKLLLPYTYFVFFQYTVVARSYSLIFPTLMYIAYIYPEKEKKIFKYGVALFILMNISSHTFIISAGLWFEFLIEELRKYKKDHNKEMKKILFFIIIAIMFSVVAIEVFPASDGSYVPGSNIDPYRIISETMFTSVDNSLIYTIGCIVFFIIICVAFIDESNRLKAGILIFPNMIWVVGVNGSGWHIGIIFLVVIFTMILTNSLNKNKWICRLIICCLIIQIYWTAVCSINDVNNKFSVGKDVRDYLVEIGYEDKKIIGVDFWPVQVNPFFKKNIYSNYTESFINWKKECFNKINSKELIEDENLYDIYIIPLYQFKYNDNYDNYTNASTYYEIKLINKLYKSGQYTYRKFDGNMYFKDKIYEYTGLYVFVKNN